jgi:hypothetical protein
MRAFHLVLLLCACAGDKTGSSGSSPTTGSEDPCEPNGDPTLDIGLGLTGYEAAEDGSPFPLIHGPQGGFHLEIGLFATGIAADDLLSGEIHGYIDGDELASAFPRLDLRCVRTGRESYGTLLVYNSTPDFLDGKTTVIEASVTDSDGTVVTAEASFVIEDTE